MNTMRGVGMRAAAWLVALHALPAGATWSVTAVDPETREVGIALASCIGGIDISSPGGLLPGVGVMTAQANTHVAGLRRGLELLAAGRSPAEVIAAVSAKDFDPQSTLSWISGRETRQYGVVALGEDAPATWTGSRTFAWAGTLSGRNVTVQGNLLRSAAVAEAAMRAFEEARGCPLADRLLRALEAGAGAGGDRRCTAELGSLSAFLEVAGPHDRVGESTLKIIVNSKRDTTSVGRFLLQLVRAERGGPDEDPVRKLRERYDLWREQGPGVRPGCSAGGARSSAGATATIR